MNSAVFGDVENEGAAQVLSRKLAAVEFAIMKLRDAIGSTVAGIDSANVSWLDVARLTEILQALETLAFGPGPDVLDDVAACVHEGDDDRNAG